MSRSRSFPEIPMYVKQILRDPDIAGYMERHPDAEPHDAMLAVIDRLRRQVEILIDALHKAQHALDALAKPYTDASSAIDRVFAEISDMEREV
jgi:Mg2+ and Co2+ transporter CorA